MSKERLEEIKNSHLRGIHSLFGTPWVSIPKENFDWLIEQAERVEELEKVEYALQETYRQEREYNKKLEQQNKRYREVINNINENAMLYGVDEQVYEAIKEAIKAVEGEE